MSSKKIQCPYCQTPVTAGENPDEREVICPQCRRALPLPEKNIRQEPEIPSDNSVNPDTPPFADEQHRASFELLTDLDRAQITRMHHDSRNLGCLGILGIIGFVCCILIFFPLIFTTFATGGTAVGIYMTAVFIPFPIYLAANAFLFRKCRSLPARTTFRFKGWIGIISSIITVIAFIAIYFFSGIKPALGDCFSTAIYFVVSWCVFRAGYDDLLFGKNHPSAHQIAARNAVNSNSEYTISQHPVAGKRISEKFDRAVSRFVLIMEIIFVVFFGASIILAPRAPVVAKEDVTLEVWQDGVNAFANKDYSKAIAIFQGFENNPQAQVYLGICYRDGLGVTANPEKAFKYFKLAADQGDPSGQLYLGACYLEGIGTAQNLPEAFNNFKLSTSANSAASQFLTGSCYLYGIGTAKNPAEAKRYLKMAADQGHKEAQELLKTQF